MEVLEQRQLLSISAQPEVMYYLKPITSGDGAGTASIVSSTGDYLGGGIAGTIDGNPYTLVLDESAVTGQTVKLELYASVFGTDSDPTNDGFLKGALDILNRPDSTPLIGKPSQVALLPEFKEFGYAKGKVQGDLSTPSDGGVDLGGPINVSTPPGSTGAWVIPCAMSNPVFGSELNGNGWTDIKLGTFSFTISDTPTSGASTQLWAQPVINFGLESVHTFIADTTDLPEEIGTNGGDVHWGPAVTIVMAGQPVSGTGTTDTTGTTTADPGTDDSDPFADLLARFTPDPHPTGDRLSDSGRLVALTAYTPTPILDHGIPELVPFVEGLRQIQANILKNHDARPSFWGEQLATGGGEYRLHLNDNGMLVSGWTIDWGDGSQPENVANQPWVIHQYPGSAGQYQIKVTAYSVNGTFFGGVGGSTGGALSQDFSAVGGSMTDSLRGGGGEPDWVEPIGSNGGQTVTNFANPPSWDQASTIALDNGNILVVGTTGDGQFGLVRYYDQPGSLNDGELDTGFGTDGLATTSFTAGSASASAVAVDGSTGTIVVAGIVLNDGSGHKEVALARYLDANGSPDNTFGPLSDGKVTDDLGSDWEGTSAVVVLSNGSIIVAGSMGGHFALLHYASDGARDTDFGGATGGIVVADFGGTDETATAMALDGNDNILVAGTSTQTGTGRDFALARFSASGVFDLAFGLVTMDFVGGDDEATSIAIQPSDGKIVLAGSSDDGTGYVTFALARFDTEGNPDGDFGPGGALPAGTATTDFGDGNDRISGIQVQYDGRIVVSGSTLLDGSGTPGSVAHFAVARYNPDGTPDESFGPGGALPAGTVTTDFVALGITLEMDFTTESSCGIILDTTGRLVVAGTATADDYSSFAVACYDPGELTLGVQANDVPPVLRVVGDQQVGEGQTLNLSELGTFTHAPVSGDFDYQIDWGDGSAPDSATANTVVQGSTLVGSFGGQHTYAVSGVYYITATITDPDGGFDTQALLVTVNASPTLLTTSIAAGTVNVGQPYTLPSIAFTDSDLLDTHRATIDWGDETVDSSYLTEPYFDDTLLCVVPGEFTNSHAYSESGDYTGTITLIDASGATATENFTVHVHAAEVALTGFSTDGHLLQVTYLISNDTASAPFLIGICSSPDGITPDQLLGYYPVGSVNSSELTAGLHTISIAPPSEDLPGDYRLIAVADSDATPDDNLRAFSGGIFRANDGTAYVFGTDAADTAGVQASSLTLNDTPYLFTSTPTAIHIRTEGGDDTVAVDTGVTTLLSIYGGAGDDSITDGGSGGNLVDGGSGQNLLHGGYGYNSPEIVDDTDPQATLKTAYYQETGSYLTVASGFNQGEHKLAVGSQATWTFTSLPSAVYDVYVTWSPQAGVATGAAYVVKNNNTSVNPIGPTSIAAVNQTAAPADDLAAGVFWHHLGAFQIAAGILTVQLSADASYPVLADAVRLVKHDEAPTTNLVMDDLSVSTEGQISVEYTINGDAAAPFTIGIYASPDGKTPTALLQTIEVDDPSLLTGSGVTHTATLDAALGELTDADYLIAKLDIGGAVYQQNRADDASSPVSGLFQQYDGAVFVLGTASYITNDHITITQNETTGDVTVSVTDAGENPIISQSFSDVSSVTVSTPGGGNTITVDSDVTVPVWVLGGSGSSVTGPTANEGVLRMDGPATVSEGETVVLTLQTAVGYGAISHWHIDWGDGNTETVSTTSPSHQYTTGNGTYKGTYTISATADDTNGITWTCPNTVSVGVLPSAPSGLSATAAWGSGGRIDLYWTNNAQLAKGYRVEQSTNGTDYSVVATLGNVQWYSVTGLLASTHYYFRVCAVNDAGRSTYAEADTTTNSIPSGSVSSNDDNSSQLVDIGMNLSLYGTQFSHVYINNNGNLTTGAPMSTYSPEAELATGYYTSGSIIYGAIIAPFFADVDTRNGHGTVSYSSTTVSGQPAWEVVWSNADYYNVNAQGHVSKTNTFSVTLVDRSDDGQPGDFDIIFSYGTLHWETGDASDGQYGLAGSNGVPARQGWSNGSGETGTYFEDLNVSGVAGGYSSLSGSGSSNHVYEIRNASVGLTAHRTGGYYGAAVSEDDERSGDPSNYVILVNDNSEQAPDGAMSDIEYNTTLVGQGASVNPTDHDLARITLSQIQPSPGRTLAGTVSLVLSNSASARIFDAAGNLLSSGDLMATLGGSGYLAGLANGDLDIYVEGLQANPDFSLTYSYVDSHERTEASASVHMAIADISVVDASGSALSLLEVSQDILSHLSSSGDPNALFGLYESLISLAFKTRIDGLHSGQIQRVTVASDNGDQFQDTLTDSATGAESSLFAVLTNNGGQPLNAAQQAAIRSLYNLNALDPDAIFVQFKTPKDQHQENVAVNSWERNLTEQEQKFMYLAFNSVWGNKMDAARRQAIRDRLKDVKLVDYTQMMKRSPVDIFKNLVNAPRELLANFTLAVQGASGITLGNRVYLSHMPNMANKNDVRTVYHELVHTIEQALLPNWFGQYISDFLGQQALGSKNAYMGIPAELRAYAFDAALNEILFTPKFGPIHQGVAQLSYGEIDQILAGGGRANDQVYRDFNAEFAKACLRWYTALDKHYHLNPPPQRR